MRAALAICLALGLTGVSPDLGFAESSFQGTAELHHVPLLYDGSQRESSFVSGVYGRLSYDWRHAIEAGFDYGQFYFADLAEPIVQNEYSLVYSYSNLESAYYRLGGHYLISDDQPTHGAYTVIAGLGRYSYQRWDAGIDQFLSVYPSYDPFLYAYQVAPRVGVYLKEDMEATKGVYLQTSGTFIRLSDDLGFNKRHFYSLEESATFFHGRWSLGVSAWVGEQAFAVLAGGMSVVNVEQLEQGGFGGSAGVTLGQATPLRVGLFRGYFSDADGENPAVATKILFSLAHSF